LECLYESPWDSSCCQRTSHALCNRYEILTSEQLARLSGAFIQLAGLKGNQGNQNYDLPAGFDPAAYRSAVIWCRAFNVVFGYAPLQPAEK
jgi:hypothetical protein